MLTGALERRLDCDTAPIRFQLIRLYTTTCLRISNVDDDGRNEEEAPDNSTTDDEDDQTKRKTGEGHAVAHAANVDGTARGRNPRPPTANGGGHD